MLFTVSTKIYCKLISQQHCQKPEACCFLQNSRANNTESNIIVLIHRIAAVPIGNCAVRNITAPAAAAFHAGRARSCSPIIGKGSCWISIIPVPVPSQTFPLISYKPISLESFYPAIGFCHCYYYTRHNLQLNWIPYSPAGPISRNCRSLKNEGRWPSIAWPIN